MFLCSGLMVRHKTTEKGMVLLTDLTASKQPCAETVKIGHTTYIIQHYFAAKGVTVSEKIERLLDKESKRECH